MKIEQIYTGCLAEAAYYIESDGEAAIIAELHAAEGAPADMGGYYHADPAKVTAIMRPSATLNAIIG